MKEQTTTLVWTLPTRMFHWLLALSFAAAYLLGDFDDYRNLHFAFGAMVGGLAILRIIFGLIGPRYSRFRDFPIGLRKQISFIRNYFSSNTYVGHNPMAALVMLAIMILGVLTALSGYLTYSGNVVYPWIPADQHTMEEFHETMAGIFLGLVIAHLAGIVFDFLFHRKVGTLVSMFTGKKNINGDDARLTAFQKGFAFLWILVPLILFYLALNLPIEKDQSRAENPLENNEATEHDDD